MIFYLFNILGRSYFGHFGHCPKALSDRLAFNGREVAHTVEKVRMRCNFFFKIFNGFQNFFLSNDCITLVFTLVFTNYLFLQIYLFIHACIM